MIQELFLSGLRHTQFLGLIPFRSFDLRPGGRRLKSTVLGIAGTGICCLNWRPDERPLLRIVVANAKQRHCFSVSWRPRRCRTHRVGGRPARTAVAPLVSVIMALALVITYSDANRKDLYHPFSLQEVLRRAWWPLAKRLELPLLQQLECLEIKERATAENLLRELEIVRSALAQPAGVSISEGDAAYMLQRIREVEPLIRGAIQDWDEVVNMSL